MEGDVFLQKQINESKNYIRDIQNNIIPGINEKIENLIEKCDYNENKMNEIIKRLENLEKRGSTEYKIIEGSGGNHENIFNGGQGGKVKY